MKLYEVSHQKTLYMPIAPSGAGKSTLFRKLKEQYPKLFSFSLDNLRHEFYDTEDYAKAFEASTRDKGFQQKANKRFLEMLATGSDIYVDNTNLSPKRRRFYLEQAKKRGYKTVAYTFNVDVDELIRRQSVRGDKNVPEDAVRRQHATLSEPLPDEFDEIRKA